MSDTHSDTHFDAIVVGSGFGGAVSAYRLAEAGLRVCVLERGRAYPPHSFPRSPRRLRQNVWDPSAGLYGLFNFWTFRHLEAVISSGLGGGSLIYANVLLRKDERWFVHEAPGRPGYEHWPVRYRDLEPHYEAVERMLGGQAYPFAAPPYDRTPRTRAFQAAAERLGLEWRLPKLAVTFANPGQPPVPGEPIQEAVPSLHGRVRHTCCLCGECVLGCNTGSKNTLDHTYLSAARRHGADIRPLSEVRALAPRPGGGYQVDYVRHAPPEADWPVPQDTANLPRQRLTADRLVLSAGALGSTFLLLSNRSAFPGLSPALGTRFNGNGDLFALARRARHADGSPLLLEPGLGPVITSAIRVPDRLDGGTVRGHYVEDCGYPEHLSWLLEAAEAPGILRRTVDFLLRRSAEALSGERESDVSADVAALLGTAERTATMMPLLGMGRDVPDGQLLLRRGRLDSDWRIDRSRGYFEGLRATMAAIAGALNAQLRLNPTFWLDRAITVHPLGGCPMGREPAEGVVDAAGEVFGYPGFFVADGSVMPGPVGPNPSLTIAALADRFAERMVQPVAARPGP
jgi:cholesterol oxidase